MGRRDRSGRQERRGDGRSRRAFLFPRLSRLHLLRQRQIVSHCAQSAVRAPSPKGSQRERGEIALSFWRGARGPRSRPRGRALASAAKIVTPAAARPSMPLRQPYGLDCDAVKSAEARAGRGEWASSIRGKRRCRCCAFYLPRPTRSRSMMRGVSCRSRKQPAAGTRTAPLNDHAPSRLLAKLSRRDDATHYVRV